MKLFVGNLPFSVEEEDFKNLFSAYNPEEAILIKNKFSGRSKGFGFVTISDDEVAKKAIAEMGGKDVGGRQLSVSEAKPMEDRPERPRRDFGDRDRGFGGSRGRSFGGGGGRGRY